MDIRHRLGQIVLWGAGTTTLLVTPFFSYDPINVPRFIVLFVFGLMGFFLLLGARKHLLTAKYRAVVGVSILFIAWGLVATFASGLNLNEGILGVTGRQTGLLAYFALIVLMISAVIASGESKSGITIHWVDANYDEGDIIFQAECTISSGDTPEILAQKIHALEHQHFAPVIEKLLRG
jgi:drug/metabolite transporter (DMT)-like permease